MEKQIIERQEKPMHPKASTILRLFRCNGEFVSGESLSRELGISRTAVWKHISALRNTGHEIEAVPSRGYRLLSSPDLLDSREVAELLKGGTVGRKLVYLPQTVSTNSDAFQRADDGAEEGTVVLADSQTGGKGRRGRAWSSPPGVNLYCSIILRPSIMPHEAPQLTFLSSVAVAKAIEQTTGLVPEIKWPNDVLIDGKKVAGLLNEMSAETDGVNFVVLGIGVNLNMERPQFPENLQYPATSLMLESGSRVIRSRFTAVMLNELDSLYAGFISSGFDQVRNEWLKRCNARGRRVCVSDADGAGISGLFSGIAPDGALLVQLGNGRVERIMSGDVRVI